MKQANWLRYIARAWSLLSLGFVLIFIVGETINPTGPAPTPSEWVGLSLFPGGVSLGLLLAWRYERGGGLLSLLSMGVFYVWSYTRSGRWPGGPYFLLVALPGLFFILAHTAERRAVAL